MNQGNLVQLHIFKIKKHKGNSAVFFSGGVAFFHWNSRITISHLNALSVAGTQRALTIYQYHKVKSESLGKEVVSLQPHSQYMIPVLGSPTPPPPMVSPPPVEM